MNRTIMVILTVLITSCMDNKNPTQHDRLINWSSEFVMEDGEHATPYYKDHDNFIQPYFSANYTTDTLTVTTLITVNCCGKTVGDIRTSHDTIFLLARHISDEACSCVEFRKYTYTIHNPDNNEFVIISES